MSGTRIAVVLLGCVGACSQNTKAADNPDLVLSKQEVRRQLSLHNDLMRDALREELRTKQDFMTSSRFSVERFAPTLLLSIDDVLPALLGQQEERIVSPVELAREHERLAQWIALLATKRSFAIRNAGSKTYGRKLPASSVALHFQIAKPGSSLAQDLRDESKAYLRLRTIVEHLSSDKREVLKRLSDKKRESDHLERDRPIESSKEIAVWVAGVQKSLDSIDRECASIGYPVSAAWAIREDAAQLRNSVSFVEGGNKTLDQWTLGTISSSLDGISTISLRASAVCKTLSERFAATLPETDRRILELAWSSTVPVSDPDPEQLRAGLNLGVRWMKDVGLSPHLTFYSLELIEPNSIHLTFRSLNAAVEPGSNELQADDDDDIDASRPFGGDNRAQEMARNPVFDLGGARASLPRNTEGDGRLFYEFVGKLLAKPTATSMSIIARGRQDASYKWSNGQLVRTMKRKPTFLVSGDNPSRTSDISLEDLDSIFSKSSRPSNEAKTFVNELTASVNSSLIKYLESFTANTRYGRVKPVEDNPWSLVVEVSNARNMVLENKDLWENVNVYFCIYPTDQGAKLVCTVKGWFGTGYIRPPNSLVDFRSMDLEYASQLNAFAGQLVVRMKDELLRQKGGPKPR